MAPIKKMFKRIKVLTSHILQALHFVPSNQSSLPLAVHCIVPVHDGPVCQTKATATAVSRAT
jgi:hypothetical protein